MNIPTVPLLRFLPQLAILSGRTLVYPDVPCEAGWMLLSEDAGACDGGSHLDAPNEPSLYPYAASVSASHVHVLLLCWMPWCVL